MQYKTTITSTQNPQIKKVIKLRKRTTRERENCFPIEGYRETLRAITHAWPLERLYYCPDFFLGENEPKLIHAFEEKGVPAIRCSSPVFQKMSYRDRPDGLLALGKMVPRNLASLETSNPTKLLVVESIEKPGNLGTMLRTCDAAGMDGLILCDPQTDLFNPNVVRASVGTLFTVPYAQCTSEEAISWLSERNIQAIIATPHAKMYHMDASMVEPSAIVIGSEQYGLSEAWMNQAGIKVKIPMLGEADSLNAAASAAILVFELVRQRLVQH